MKKNLKYLIMVGIVSLLPINAKALTGTFKVECNDTNLRVGRSTKCTLKGKFNEELTGLNFSLSKSDALSISNVEIKDPYTLNLHDGLNYGLLRSGTVNVEHNIATFDVKLNSDTTGQYITTYNLEAVPAEGYDSYTQSPITVNFTNNKSTDNTLKTITVGSKTVNVTSSSTTYEFTTNNNVSKVNISAVANDSGASIIGGGEKTLSVGLNTFTLSVEAEAGGTPKEYTIKITRSANNSGSSDVISNNDNTNNTPSTTNNTTNSNTTSKTSSTTSKTTTSAKKTSTSNKTIKNPKTGNYLGISVGIIIIVISGISYLLVRKEKYFNK